MTEAVPSVNPQRLFARGVREPHANGRFVLYWMHHALRFHENPALAAACALARRFDLPLLVHQGLNANYRHASDRLHTFLLESARSAAIEAKERGFRHAFHLETAADGPDHLVALADAAAVVVTERVPIGPTEAFARRAAERTKTPWIEVDASCLCPMGTFDKPFDRAFAFRDAARQHWLQALTRPLPEPTPPAPWTGDLPYIPTPIETADIADLVASCDIDHRIPPIPDTRGGSEEGYRRFDAFLTDKLAAYADDRNDPLADATSRVSAYLHVGCVAPWRLARRAAAIGNDGADKWIDELLTWRELAWHWCHHNPGDARWEDLPSWARRSFDAHAKDPRKVFPRSALERGATGDALWDACATSLLRQGELHNNLRMTWVKAIPMWRPDGADAYATAIAINDALSLDGRDPASIGGIGWGFGLFDRPHTPETPVLGSVRSRPTDAMARRIDVAALNRHVRRPLVRAPAKVAIVGAGLAGLRAADVFDLAGFDVHMFDKGRVAGGRLATRRSEGALCDHGAPSIDAHHPRFVAWCDALVDEGVLERDGRRRVRVESEGRSIADDRRGARYIARSANAALTAHLAEGRTLRCGSAVTACVRIDGRWILRFDDGGEAGPFDGLLLTAPAPQAAALLGRAHAWFDRLSTVAYAPCITAMATFDDAVDPEADVFEFSDGPIATAVRGRTPGIWVLHGTATYSLTELDTDPETSAGRLVEAWGRRLGASRTPSWFRAHRWRFARAVADPLVLRPPVDADALLAVAGDAFGGGDAQGAWLSGESAAARLRDAVFARSR